MRTCYFCGLDQPDTAFPAYRKTSGVSRNRRTKCLGCRNKSQTEASWRYNEANPRRHHFRYLKMKEVEWEHRRDVECKSMYGLPIGGYRLLLEAQGERCAICRRTVGASMHRNQRRFCVDHDAETGKIRDLLCTDCNLTIGRMRHRIDLLEAAIEYLKHHE